MGGVSSPSAEGWSTGAQARFQPAQTDRRGREQAGQNCAMHQDELGDRKIPCTPYEVALIPVHESTAFSCDTRFLPGDGLHPGPHVGKFDARVLLE